MVKMWTDLETLPREELEKRQLRLFRHRMRYVIEKSPFYKRKYKEAGVAPGEVGELVLSNLCCETAPLLR